MEELAFWQAVTLADKYKDAAQASVILRPVLAQDARQNHSIDLIRRLVACGLIERSGAGDELIAQIV